MTYEVIELDAAQVDRVEPLWNAMVRHHDAIVGGSLPVHDPEDAWRRRRAQYVDWLTHQGGRLLAAVPSGDRAAPPVGYAALLAQPPGPTWELGERVGELESLAVAEHARGQGVGTLLIAAAREILRAQGIEYWAVAVVEANAGATRLYEREGFGPFYRSMLGRV